MSWNNQGSVPGNISSCLFCTFLDDETTESPEVNILTVYHRILNGFHESFNRSLDSDLLDSGLVSNFCYRGEK